MDIRPHLLITGELYDQIKVGKLKAKPLRYLRNLEFDGRLVIETELTHIARCSGLLCRPTSSGRVTEQMLESASLPFVIGTLSVGDDHIDKVLRNNPEITVIKAGSDSNAKAVAEHAVSLANTLLRGTYQSAIDVGAGVWRNAPYLNGRRLDGLTWGCLGSGTQVSALCPLLWAHGLREIVIINHRIDEKKFGQCIGPFLSMFGRKPPHSLEVEVESPAGGKLRIIGTGDEKTAFARLDVLSLHIPGHLENVGYVNSQRIAALKPGCLLLNTARGDILDEDAVLQGFEAGVLSGYGADVLRKEAESSRDPSHSPLWKAFMSSSSLENLGANRMNIVITPHIGGCTEDSNEAIAQRVIHRVLAAIGVSTV
jgi:phosphoglycerate dehydrogenase-like enzyme